MKYTTMLPLETFFGSFKTAFNAAAVRYDGGIAVVDVGFPGFLPKLEETLEKAGLNPGDIKKVIITHADGDHVGALRALVKKYPGVEVLSSPKQAAYIMRKEKHPRITAAERRLAAAVSDEQKQEAVEDMARINAIETVDTVTAVRDGQTLPECGLEFVIVDGHLPDHLCVYVPKDKVMITGDAVMASDGRLCPPSDAFTLDMPAAIRSLNKLLEYDIEHMICYHGGLVSGNIRAQLEEIIRNAT